MKSTGEPFLDDAMQEFKRLGNIDVFNNAVTWAFDTGTWRVMMRHKHEMMAKQQLPPDVINDEILMLEACKHFGRETVLSILSWTGGKPEDASFNPNPVPSPSSIVEQEKWNVRREKGWIWIQDGEAALTNARSDTGSLYDDLKTIRDAHNTSIERAVKQRHD